MELVAGRECGACTVCCVVPNIDAPEFRKPAGIPCGHLCATGCSIHSTVYAVCRTYHCAWRYMAQMPEDWRPDLSGILIDFQVDHLPPHYSKRPGIRLTLCRGKDTPIHAAVLDYMARLIAAQVPVVLAVPGPKGHFPAGAFLNDALQGAVAARDRDRVAALVSDAVHGLAAHVFAPVMAQHATNP
jgi:hypothetical protein